jgi:GNAT superfamily N-acetyltransferase
MNRLQKKWRARDFRPSTQRIVDALKKIKIKVYPYLIFVEEFYENITHPQIDNELNKYKIVFLGPEDMKTIEALPDRKPTETELLNRLNEKKVCIALKHGQELAAFTWYDLKECNIHGIKCPINDNEAYLFDAYTQPSYRGKGIAPFVRYRSYQELKNIGKHRLLSFSNYYNTPAIRFKQKLKAKPIELRIAVGLRGLRIDLRLRRYGESITKFRYFYVRFIVKGIKIIDSV